MGDPYVNPGRYYAPHIEHLVLKHPGTGTADTTAHELFADNRKDTLATMLQDPAHLQYVSCAENVSSAKMRAALLDRMVAPCGAPPEHGKRKQQQQKMFGATEPQIAGGNGVKRNREEEEEGGGGGMHPAALPIMIDTTGSGGPVGSSTTEELPSHLEATALPNHIPANLPYRL